MGDNHVRKRTYITCSPVACCLFFAPMMEAVCNSETSVHSNEITWRYIPEDSKLHTRRRENIKCHKEVLCCNVVAIRAVRPHCCVFGRGLPTILVCVQVCRSWGSSVSVVSDYGLDDRAIGIRSLARAKDFSSSLCVQTGSGGPPSLLYNGYWG
jgi:hypothetical protein